MFLSAFLAFWQVSFYRFNVVDGPCYAYRHCENHTTRPKDAKAKLHRQRDGDLLSFQYVRLRPAVNSTIRSSDRKFWICQSQRTTEPQFLHSHVYIIIKNPNESPGSLYSETSMLVLVEDRVFISFSFSFPEPPSSATPSVRSLFHLFSRHWNSSSTAFSNNCSCILEQFSF